MHAVILRFIGMLRQSLRCWWATRWRRVTVVLKTSELSPGGARCWNCISAIARRQREGAAADLVAESYRRLGALRDGWQEVHASESLHRTAVRLLKTHPLRAGDALQLGAALVASNFEAYSAHFLTEDARLKQAAEREGFGVD
jgi:predicted nucleic acid-binding protein